VPGDGSSAGSLFLRLFLGQVNVRVASKKDRDQMREEYEKFKTRTNYGGPRHLCRTSSSPPLWPPLTHP